MTRISYLISVVGGIKSDTEARVGKLRAITGNAGLFSGHERTYQPRADDGAPLPPESQKVQTSATELLAITRQLLTREWDVVRTLDEANAGAFADVKVGGEVLLEHVPVGHLLWLTRQLEQLHTLVAGLPELDAARSWEPHVNGQFRAPAVQTVKTKKTPYNHVLAEATQYHPAQVQIMSRDDVLGYWSTVPLSGAIDVARKQQLLDRVAELRDAVKMAREEANSALVTDKHEGDAVFNWLLSA